MVQALDNNRPVYNAVKINIKKPEVNAGVNAGVNVSGNTEGNTGENTVVNNNGIYNAVSIDIDNPSVNTSPKKVYDYPEALSPVTYDMANIQQIPLPQGFQVAYQTTNVILPKIENEVEVEAAETEEAEDTEEETAVEANEEESKEAQPAAANEPTETAQSPAEVKPEVPAPNYTTVEKEKGTEEPAAEQTAEPAVPAKEEVKPEEIKEVKKPEIIPAEEILPDVDIPLVISNLTSSDFDTQALQMEEIARISLDNSANAVPYIVREVFSSLIDITNKDTTSLATPTQAQVDARRKVIANFAALEQGAQQPPYPMTQEEIVLANELSPMEQAERNKEYALYTMSILAKIYTDEVEKQTGNIVPMTDLPGTSAIVDALRYNPNAGVKIASIDALRHIARPEYKEELNTLFSLAQADTNPQVALSASRALNDINNK